MTETSNKFTVSVCICTRNRPDELRHALDSVAASTMAAGEVIVSDDSTDNQTRQLIDDHFPKVRYIEGPRRGLCANRNRALSATCGSHILFIDDDVTLNPTFLQEMRDVYDQLPDDKKAQTILTGSEINLGRHVTPSAQSFLGYQSRAYQANDEYETVVINATLFPRSLFHHAWFNENIIYGYDEVDITTRAVGMGFHIKACLSSSNIHTPSTINRDHYAPFIEASRLYVTLRRYLLTDRSPLKAAAYAAWAPAHLALHLLKSSAKQPLQSWLSTMRTSTSYLATDARNALLHRKAYSPLTKSIPAKDKGPASVHSLSVLIPSYKRPQDLENCLNALKGQNVEPSEVVVVARPDDLPTIQVAERFSSTLPVRVVTVEQSGQVAALNIGIAAVAGDIVALTDDDALPHPDWLERIVAAFSTDPSLAGVGGRDIMHLNGSRITGQEMKVGIVPRVGKMHGNHHMGVGPARYVDVIKGVNSAYRTAEIRRVMFDTRLRGSGAQVHNEIGVGMKLQQNGWKLWYDPEIVVDHMLGQRFDEDKREGFNPIAARNISFNEHLLRLERLTPMERRAQILWAFAIGTRAAPGMVQLFRFLPSQKMLAVEKFSASFAGLIDAVKICGNR